MKEEYKKVLQGLQESSKNTLLETLEIKFTDFDGENITAEMPVTSKVHQPYKMMHGGASAVLAESVGSTMSSMVALANGKISLGSQITSNHLRSIKSGKVIAEGKFIKKGKTVHILQIDIKNENGDLISHNTLQTMVVDMSKVS